MKIVVVGGGIIGMTAALRLQENDYQVEVWAKALPPYTTSNIAAAIWYPARIEPVEGVRRWAAETLQVLVEEANDPASGVSLRQGRKLFHRPMGKPWWAALAPKFEMLGKDALEGRARCAYELVLPVIDMSTYLGGTLYQRFNRAGGRVLQRELHDLNEASQQADWVVNATGLGARTLVGDETLFPIRGQLARTTYPVEEFLLDTDHPEGMIYAIPNPKGLILGGSTDEGNWTLSPDAEQHQRILERARTMLGTQDLVVREIVVGLRPGRPSIRVEREGRVVHCYGHGGIGVTLSWGTANEVLRLVSEGSEAFSK